MHSLSIFEAISGPQDLFAVIDMSLLFVLSMSFLKQGWAVVDFATGVI